MSNKQFITNILNLDDSQINSISTISQSDGSLLIFITLVSDPKTTCPICGQKPVHNGFYTRRLNHATLVNRPCTIIYKRRRFFCKHCQFSFSERNPFIHTREAMTLETKINVLQDLKVVSNTYSIVAKRFNLSVPKVIRIFDQCVNIKRKKLPAVLSIDEHYFPESSFDSLYICVLMDFCTGTIIDILPDRKKDYLSQYFATIRNRTLTIGNISELNRVKYISIDMYENYKELAQTYFPQAIICVDSFHVIKHLNDAFNQIRLSCRRATQDEKIQYLLTKFKYIFRHRQNLDNEARYNKRFKRYLNYRDILNILFDHFPKLQAAYQLKERYIWFNQNSNLKNAEKRLTKLILAFADSDIPEYNEFYNLLINWNKEIINSFTLIDDKRINNSYIESRNNQIERLLYNAYGLRNFERARNRILYCLNKDDHYTI